MWFGTTGTGAISAIELKQRGTEITDQRIDA